MGETQFRRSDRLYVYFNPSTGQVDDVNAGEVVLPFDFSVIFLRNKRHKSLVETEELMRGREQVREGHSPAFSKYFNPNYHIL